MNTNLDWVTADDTSKIIVRNRMLIEDLCVEVYYTTDDDCLAPCLYECACLPKLEAVSCISMYLCEKVYPGIGCESDDDLPTQSSNTLLTLLGCLLDYLKLKLNT